ncbi:MAG: extracellular solute-binding protein [Firmicutes bacterium]|nr:extracellular solute-binding protein [Bacillota bacterium]
MPTIKDIAREAGVSHGTVSNVLNKTGKVSVEKIKLVEAAMKKLGYTYNTRARELRSGTSRNIALVIPSLQIDCYLDLYESISKALANEGYMIVVFETNDIANTEEKIWSSDSLSGMCAIICISCLGERLTRYNLSCPIIFVNRTPDTNIDNSGSISFDFYKAGSEIGRRISDNHWKNVILFSSSFQFTESKLIYEGMQASLNSVKEENFSLKHYSFDFALTNNTAFNLLQENPDADVIVTSNMLLADAISTAAKLLELPRTPNIITITPCRFFPNSHYITYEMNYVYMGNIIVKSLLEHLNNKNPLPEKQKISEQGFRFTFPMLKKCGERILSLLTIPTPNAEALKTLSPNFYKQTGIKLKITTVPYENLQAQFKMQNEEFHFDLIRMDISWFTELANEIYKPLPDVIGDTSQLPSHMLQRSYSDYTTVGQTMYALPFDPSALVLLYRKDLFEDAIQKRSYYEMYHETLEIPKTYDQLQKISRFFTRSFNPNSPVEYGLTMTIGAASVAVCDFLPRLYSLCPNLCENDRINIYSDSSVKALQDYVDSFQYTSKLEHSWWKDSMLEFVSGKSAMIQIFSNYASYSIDSKYSRIIGETGASVVPGRKPLLGGGLVGASKFTNKKDEIKQFFQWYYSRDISSAIIALGGSAPLPDILNNYDFSLYPWLSIFTENLEIGTRNLNLSHMPHFPLREFEGILGSVVYNAVKGIMTPDEALKYAQNMYDTLLNGSKLNGSNTNQP